MTTLEAHAAFASRSDYGLSLMPDGHSPTHPETSPVLLAAAVALSGQLEDCKTDEDLDDAVVHFASLVNAGVFDAETWDRESEAVLGEVLAWGDEVCGVTGGER